MKRIILLIATVVGVCCLTHAQTLMKPGKAQHYSWQDGAWTPDYTMTFTRDLNGRPTAVEIKYDQRPYLDSKFAFTYDGQGRKTRATEYRFKEAEDGPEGSYVAYVENDTVFTYTPACLASTAVTNGYGKTVTTYNEAGMPLEEKRYSNTSENPDSPVYELFSTETTEYDDVVKTFPIRKVYDGQVGMETTVTRDAAGRVTMVECKGGDTFRYMWHYGSDGKADTFTWEVFYDGQWRDTRKIQNIEWERTDGQLVESLMYLDVRDEPEHPVYVTGNNRVRSTSYGHKVVYDGDSYTLTVNSYNIKAERKYVTEANGSWTISYDYDDGSYKSHKTFYQTYDGAGRLIEDNASGWGAYKWSYVTDPAGNVTEWIKSAVYAYEGEEPSENPQERMTFSDFSAYVAGIGDTATDHISDITVTEGRIMADGALSIRIYNTAGALLGATQGDVLHIGAMPHGVLIVKADYANGPVVKKIIY